jgi:ABC-type uncharacterized transport system ATPase subunit
LKTNPWHEKQKLNDLEDSLERFWELLSLSLKSNQRVWNKFMNIQQRVKILKMKLEKDLENEQSRN